MLVAYTGVLRQFTPPAHEFVGFPADAPRQDGFIAPGQLTHVVKQDAFAPNGFDVRLTVRIQLNHDRVFSHSIDGCLMEIEHVSHSLYDSLSVGDPTFVEEFVAGELTRFNGTSAVRSVELLDFKTLPAPGTNSGGSANSMVIDEPSDAPKDRTSRSEDGKSIAGPR